MKNKIMVDLENNITKTIIKRDGRLLNSIIFTVISIEHNNEKKEFFKQEIINENGIFLESKIIYDYSDFTFKKTYNIEGNIKEDTVYGYDINRAIRTINIKDNISNLKMYFSLSEKLLFTGKELLEILELLKITEDKFKNSKLKKEFYIYDFSIKSKDGIPLYT